MEKASVGRCLRPETGSDAGAVGQGLVENSDTERQPYTSYHYVASEEHLLDEPVGRHDPDLAACVQQVQLQLAGGGRKVTAGRNRITRTQVRALHRSKIILLFKR